MSDSILAMSRTLKMVYPTVVVSDFGFGVNQGSE